MALLTPQLLQQLIDNGKLEWAPRESKTPVETVPVVLLRRSGRPPRAWLLAAVDPDDQDLAFGLFEETGYPPELGLVRLQEIEALNGVYLDPLFERTRKLSLQEHTRMARLTGRITLVHDFKP